MLISYPWIPLSKLTYSGLWEGLVVFMGYLNHCGFPGGSDGKVPAPNVGDPGLIPGMGRSSGEGNGNPLQYSFLPGEFHGQRSLVPQFMGSQRVRLSDYHSALQQTHIFTVFFSLFSIMVYHRILNEIWDSKIAAVWITNLGKKGLRKSCVCPQYLPD